ncbi:MAG: hypothetical protein AABZ53_08770 [Planctomycetota bacterium]
MSCACQGRLGTVVAVVVGLGAATVGAVNFARTGCPLGTCCEGEGTSVVTESRVPASPVVSDQLEASDARMTDAQKIAADELKKEEERLKAEAEKKAAEPSGK